MDIQTVNYILKLVREALERLTKLNGTAQMDGLPPFDLLPKKTALELTTAHNYDLDDEALRLAYRRMKNRDRQRRYRQRHQQTRNNYKTVAGDVKCVMGNKKSVTCNAETVTRNAATPEALPLENGDASPAQDCADAASATTEAEQGNLFCDADVTETRNASVTGCNAFAKKEKENEKRKRQRKEINKKQKNKTNIADAMPNSARAREENAAAMKNPRADVTNDATKNSATGKSTFANPDGSCLPFVSPEPKKSELIPTDELSEACRNVVRAWNKLPLPKKLSGLFPSLVKRLNYLLENYGEEAVHNAIASIANSPFLLGKSRNNRGWVINFSWLVEPENLEKILSGQYQDDVPGRHCLFQPGDELQPIPEGFYGTVVY